MAYAIGGEANYYQPPEPVLCAWCDGAAWVDVASITDTGGTVHQLSEDSPYRGQHEIRCPRCSGTGEEPPGRIMERILADGVAPDRWTAIARHAVILLAQADTADAREMARQTIYDLGSNLDQLIAVLTPMMAQYSDTE